MSSFRPSRKAGPRLVFAEDGINTWQDEHSCTLNQPGSSPEQARPHGAERLPLGAAGWCMAGRKQSQVPSQVAVPVLISSNAGGWGYPSFPPDKWLRQPQRLMLLLAPMLEVGLDLDLACKELHGLDPGHEIKWVWWTWHSRYLHEK